MTLDHLTITPPPVHCPEFAPLPQKGLCPYTCLSRSGLYRLERLGRIKLARLRQPGNVKGRVFVPVQQTLAAMRVLMSYGTPTKATK